MPMCFGHGSTWFSQSDCVKACAGVLLTLARAWIDTASMRAGSSALNVMRTRSGQRRVATVLSLALCLWFVADAMHAHPGDDFSLPQGIAHHCDFCLARPASAAPPPAETPVPAAVLFEVSPPSNDATAVTGHAAPSSYLSRAPPAA